MTRPRPCDTFEWAYRFGLALDTYADRWGLNKTRARERLAGDVGLSPETLRSILYGRLQPSSDAQGSLAEAMGEDPGWLFPRTEMEKIRAEMFRLSPTQSLRRGTRRTRGLRVATPTSRAARRSRGGDGSRWVPVLDP